jgi:hypothetical protein
MHDCDTTVLTLQVRFKSHKAETEMVSNLDSIVCIPRGGSSQLSQGTAQKNLESNASTSRALVIKTLEAIVDQLSLVVRQKP